MPEIRKVLVVDDEVGVLRSLYRLLRRNNFRVLLANSAEKALQLIDRETIPVVLSDYRMPGMTGGELFSEVALHHPDTVRILLTGQADKDAVITAINKGAVYKFLEKPWDAELLLETIDAAFVRYELVADNKKLTQDLEKINEDLLRLNAALEDQVEEKTQELVKAVYYDALTGLPSRELIIDRLDQALKSGERSSSRVIVLFLGIDSFKYVNESMGLDVGDQLLKSISRRLETCLRACDSVSRFSGDEFCMILGDASLVEDPALVAQRIMEVVARPFKIDGREIFLTGSIGISMFPADGETCKDLLNNAESAMYKAKEHGPNNYQYFSEEFNELAEVRLSLEAQLRRAIDKREFLLHYQPRVNIETGELVGVEALIRWQHPERGLLPPIEFLPMLEETGLIEPVGRWVLKEACEALVRWKEQGFPPIQMAVNLSARQFIKGRLIGIIRKIINETDSDYVSKHLELEITESLLLEDVDSIREILDDLSCMGIKLALDDFGTGYSSLSYLIRFPIDYLKIDKSFVDEIGRNPDAKAIIAAIMSLAQSLRMHVIAEGIETQSQLDEIQKLGCSEFQGYLFSQPLAEHEIIQLLVSKQELSTGEEDSRSLKRPKRLVVANSNKKA